MKCPFTIAFRSFPGKNWPRDGPLPAPGTGSTSEHHSLAHGAGIDGGGVEVKYCHQPRAKTKDPPYANSHFLKTGFCPPFLPWAVQTVLPNDLVWEQGSKPQGFSTTPGLLWMLESSAVVERRRIIRNLIAQGGRDAVKLVAAVSNICG